MLDTTLFRILALSDSGFPSGGFAHSNGLEAAASFGATEEADDVRAFAEDALDQAASLQGPLVCEAHRIVRAKVEVEERLVALDSLAEARTSGAVTNRASRTQGRTFFSTASGIFPLEIASLAAVAGRLPFMHHAPLFGATLAALEVPLERTMGLYLFGQTRGTLSAAVRLGLLGPNEAQTMLDALGPALARAADRAMSTSLEEAASVSPLLELRAQLHDALYARLFVS